MRLDHTNPDSIERNVRLTIATLRGLKHNLVREAERAAPNPGDRGALELDVRLVSNEDGELWFATGDVQYDTVHGAACEATVIRSDDTDEQIRSAAQDLVNGVADQLAEQAA
jgi:hypothetical protein